MTKRQRCKVTKSLIKINLYLKTPPLLLREGIASEFLNKKYISKLLRSLGIDAISYHILEIRQEIFENAKNKRCRFIIKKQPGRINQLPFLRLCLICEAPPLLLYLKFYFFITDSNIKPSCVSQNIRMICRRSIHARAGKEKLPPY